MPGLRVPLVFPAPPFPSPLPLPFPQMHGALQVEDSRYPGEEKPQECPSCPHCALSFPSSSLQPLPGSEAPARCETPLPLGRRLGWPWGLFWEQLLRSNGLVRATLTFLSGEEGRTGGGGAAGRWTAPHTPGVAKGASALQEFRLGGGWDGHREVPLFEADWGPFHPTASLCFSKGSAFFL